MIPREALIADFQTMLRDKWGYIPATAGEVWTQEKQNKATSEMVRKYGQQWVGHRVADCSGAFVCAYKKHGLSIYHGSNRIARAYVVELLPVSQAKPGMAAFKAREPGEQLYDLPSEYKQGGSHYNGDLKDYYHIGLVDTDTHYAMNSQSTHTGFVRSRMIDGWDAVGYLKAVNYNGGVEKVPDNYMTVTSDDGKPVNLRTGPGLTYPIVARVAVGKQVNVLDESGDWAHVQYDSRSGYMKSEFLHGTNGGGVLYDHVAAVREALRKARAYIDEAEKSLDNLT